MAELAVDVYHLEVDHLNVMLFNERKDILYGFLHSLHLHSYKIAVMKCCHYQIIITRIYAIVYMAYVKILLYSIFISGNLSFPLGKSLVSWYNIKNETKRRTTMISGLQKMTLLDYPGKVACTVFLQGCNYRCPFCHNTDLLPREGEPLMTEEEFFRFLETRKGLLDAVCVSGGEPTLQKDLEQFLAKIHDMGFAVKLDTNGGRPDILKKVVEAGVVDYVAMDIKNSPDRYAATCGLGQMNLEKTEESVRYLIGGAVDYELRTTVVKPLHDAETIGQMGQFLASVAAPKKPKVLYLQSFVDRESVAFAGLCAPDKQELERFVQILSPYVQKVVIRGT